MLITCVLHIRHEGHREPRNEVGSLSRTERLVGFEPGTDSDDNACRTDQILITTVDHNDHKDSDHSGL